MSSKNLLLSDKAEREKLETNCLAKLWAAKHVNPVCAFNSAELIIIKAVAYYLCKGSQEQSIGDVHFHLMVSSDGVLRWELEPYAVYSSCC